MIFLRKKKKRTQTWFGDTKMLKYFYTFFSISKGSQGEPFPDDVPEIHFRITHGFSITALDVGVSR